MEYSITFKTFRKYCCHKEKPEKKQRSKSNCSFLSEKKEKGCVQDNCPVFKRLKIAPVVRRPFIEEDFY